MSIASRSRQAARDKAAGRERPERHEPLTVPPPPRPFNVTEFQAQAHKATLTVIPEKGKGKVRVKPVKPAKQQPWQRDGYASAEAYHKDHEEDRRRWLARRAG